jgi:hypothetical protein
MKTSKDILESIGHARVADAVGVTLKRVKRAVSEPKLPAGWYVALCRLSDGELPRERFTFKGMD